MALSFAYCLGLMFLGISAAFPPEWATVQPLVNAVLPIAPPWLDPTGTSVPSYYVEWLTQPWMNWTNNVCVTNNGPLHGQGVSAFFSGVLAPNGKVILVPYNSTVVGIYDPVLNTFAAGPVHGQGANAFVGGVLAPNGKVVLVPFNSTVVGIYDPVLNTFAAGPVHGRGASAFFGGVLAPNGKVILVPHNSTVVGIYDPVLNTFAAGPVHGRGASAFIGGVLAPNGKVILVPQNSTVVMPLVFSNSPAISIEHCLHPVLNKL